MRIQHNIPAMNAYRNLSNNSSALNKNLEKLSSGYKINRAGDDAAGLAISEKMRAQITGLNKAQDNAKDGISLIQTAEGALTEVHDMLNRMYELAEQSANGTYESGTDRAQLQKEVNQLRAEIDRISDSSNFNGIELLNGDRDTSVSKEVAMGEATWKFSFDYFEVDGATGSTGAITINVGNIEAGEETAVISAGGTVTITLATGTQYSAADIQSILGAATGSGDSTEQTQAIKSATVTGSTSEKMNAGTSGTVAAVTATDFGAKKDNALTLQIGDTGASYNQLDVSIRATDSESLGVDTVDISSQKSAADALGTIKAAINYVSDVRGTLGANQNRLDHTINNLSVMEENIQDAESSIRDTDIAEEMMAYTKNNILIQSAQAMLAQANQVPQGVLQLLQ